MWGSLIDYWYFTGDTSYNDVIEAGIEWQTGVNDDMMPTNWSASMGNDDQGKLPEICSQSERLQRAQHAIIGLTCVGFWGMTAMTAAETNFQNPPSNEPGWLALAQAVFNTQATRPDHYCNGGWVFWNWMSQILC